MAPKKVFQPIYSCNDHNISAHMFPELRSEVNSIGYSEFEKPIRVDLQRHRLI